MSLFLGVDGGQTTTKVVLADAQGRILSEAAGGPSNHTEETGGPERLEQVIRSAVADALSTAHAAALETQEFAAACFGMTGETEIKRQVLEGFIRTPHLSVVHDSVNALVGATAGEPGVIVIAGTGSVARGMDAQGRDMRVSGWGHLFGDEGSAHWIGREAVRAVAAECEHFGPTSRLTPVFFERLGVSSALEIMAKYYSGEWSRDHLAGLAICVDELAEGGDRVALEILNNAGDLLAKFALEILSTLFPTRPNSQRAADWKPPLVSYIGGVFKSRFVLSAFRDAILSKFHDAEVRPPIMPPVLGSLLLAYRSAGKTVAEQVRNTWIKTLSRRS